MKFLCDVHISYRVTKHLQSLGFKAIHVNEILNKWWTTDEMICDYADKNDYIVITKDSDFRNSFYIKRTPKKLLKINLGNISSNQLIKLIADNLSSINKLNKNPFFIIEIDTSSVQFNIPNNN
jgi:predicted nuclease of predicted toxin-antitoxin system